MPTRHQRHNNRGYASDSREDFEVRDGVFTLQFGLIPRDNWGVGCYMAGGVGVYIYIYIYLFC